MSAMAVSQKSIPVKIADAFTTVELIRSVLHIGLQRCDLGFLFSRET